MLPVAPLLNSDAEKAAMMAGYRWYRTSQRRKEAEVGPACAFSQRIYGMNSFGDLFTSRQLLNLTTLVKICAPSRSACTGRIER